MLNGWVSTNTEQPNWSLKFTFSFPTETSEEYRIPKLNIYALRDSKVERQFNCLGEAKYKKIGRDLKWFIWLADKKWESTGY